MKCVKKIVALVIACVMCMSMGITVFAQTVGTAAEGKGSITVQNAAKGETYSVVKVFGATLSGDNAGIAYTGTIPNALKEYFVADSVGNITKKAGVEDTALTTAVQEWAKNQTVTASAISDGTALTFEGLDYGYYAVVTTQGAVVTVDSTMPNVTVYDKNSKKPSADKTVEKESYTVGDTVKYTATFGTANYQGEGSAAKQVVDYVISDTLPEFLSGVVVDSIIVDEDGNLGTTNDQHVVTAQFDSNNKIKLDWADEIDGTVNPKEWKSRYKNGAKIVMTYHGTLTSIANINTANINTVKIVAHVVKDDGTPDKEHPWDENWEKDAEIKTYAAALKKTDGTNALAGAEFTIAGLTVTKGNAKGEYIVESYDPTSTTQSATLVTNDDGKLYIIGLASDTKLSVTETKAPDGYNKLETPIELTPQLLKSKIYKESGTIKYDAKGNVIASEKTAETTETVEKNLSLLDTAALTVVNNKGTELPSTGGIGTTIFYILGSILLIGAVVLLVTKKRMSSEQ